MTCKCIEDILIIVVLYKIKITECKSIQSILTVLKGDPIEFLVYDNSPECNIGLTGDTALVKFNYVGDIKNSGVSKAYNLGAKLASDRKKKWLLLCDQDTEFTPDYFNSICRIIYNFMPNLVAPYLFSNTQMISPCAFTMNYGRPLKKMPLPGWATLNRIALLNSGLIINREAFEKCGGYDEKVFLDFSDFDFIKKYRKIVGKFYQMDVRLEHHLESDFRKDFNAQRFIKYCQSYRGAIHNFFDLLSISSIVLLRTLKLAVRHRNVSPIQYWFRYFMIN